MNATKLRRLEACQVPEFVRIAVDQDTLDQAAKIVKAVKERGLEALSEIAAQVGDLDPLGKLIYSSNELQAAYASLTVDQQGLLERTAEKIRRFASAQRESLAEISISVPGGLAGQRITPLRRAGCYAPGGRFPLPSSVLMTAVTARTAGVETVWVASPRPAQITLAAAHVAQADYLLAAGGAQAIAAMAYGANPVPACDVVVGPGNCWVTAAKQLVAGQVAIDMLAGPSELVVVADATADPGLIAADLLAQAEHDPQAICILISLDQALPDRVDIELEAQLSDLPTRATAAKALANGFCLVVENVDQAVEVCDQLAPEHLELCCQDSQKVSQQLTNYGAVFIGASGAEVFGDYGIGPNHVLPTGGTARFSGGLSVLNFLKVTTWLRIDQPQQAGQFAADAAALARLEGLEAHARAAERRKP
ncbi:MAG: histidinol dehydrogenase [Deltaproteobacteria bacterium]|nr:histidinol dehydrogenase [Deltaproteobacteria bacterium]MBW1873235.1 histidinol dehydrogenase [Deltaproteobacteria bacterium]